MNGAFSSDRLLHRSPQGFKLPTLEIEGPRRGPEQGGLDRSCILDETDHGKMPRPPFSLRVEEA